MVLYILRRIVCTKYVTARSKDYFYYCAAGHAGKEEVGQGESDGIRCVCERRVMV